MLPGSRRMPYVVLPMPEDPPAMKPPSVAVRLVEGWKRSSPPTSRFRCASRSISLMPACARTTPGFAQSTRSNPVISSTMPPFSGIAWP
jgi:hypothetical protein